MDECKKCQDMLSSYIDGALSEQEKKMVDAHLAACASCRSLLVVYKSIFVMTPESLAEPPAHFAAGVMDKLSQLPKQEYALKTPARKQKKSLKPVIISFAAAAACLALVFIISPQLFRVGSPVGSLSASKSDTATNAEMAMEQGRDELALIPKADDDLAYGSIPAPSEELMESVMTDTQSDSAPSEDGTIPRADLIEQWLHNYSDVFYITGALPEVLENAEKIDQGDGTFAIEISAETADALREQGFISEGGANTADTAVVVYTPA